MSASKERFWRKDNPICYALAVSGLILAGYVMIGLREHCIGNACETNFRVFWEADPNEIGDTLAGLFSALAFVWIIATVMMQSKELASQREELGLARRESKRTADAMSEQVAFLRSERREREEMQAEQLFKELLNDAVQIASESNDHLWTKDEDNLEPARHQLKMNFEENAHWEHSLKQMVRAFEIVDSVEWRCREGEYFPVGYNVFRFSELESILKCLEELGLKMSQVNQHRLSRIELASLRRNVEKLATNPVFWKQHGSNPQ